MNRALLAGQRNQDQSGALGFAQGRSGVIKKAAQQAAPVLQVPTKTRESGTVRKAIAVRNSKFARQAGDEGVFVGVRPRTRIARRSGPEKRGRA
ncbi:hypothetical protein [Propionivibrio sp.]|uniref:hypothetical protein n=1 Tax=Propionivibrio sp. TaxID=2212460 RepID=UPI0025D70156|nr:hypothetical protein [Propionivibrio sp.]MBK7357506.1 hypothetical protein [Propionivibrio sp.]